MTLSRRAARRLHHADHGRHHVQRAQDRHHRRLLVREHGRRDDPRQAHGIGGYRVSGIDSVNLVNLDSPDPFVAWSLVVFYRLATDPERNLTLYDGLDFVGPRLDGHRAALGISRPQHRMGRQARGAGLTKGDFVFTGDSLLFGNHTLTDGVNPGDNFFNGSRSWLGTPGEQRR